MAVLQLRDPFAKQLQETVEGTTYARSAARRAIIPVIAVLQRYPMPIPMEVLAAEVLALPPDERSQLLDRLLASFDAEPFDPSWEQAWAAEVDRREAAIESGQAVWLSGEEVVTRLRAQLK